jgi:hypothetical protein
MRRNILGIHRVELLADDADNTVIADLIRNDYNDSFTAMLEDDVYTADTLEEIARHIRQLNHEVAE